MILSTTIFEVSVLIYFPMGEGGPWLSLVHSGSHWTTSDRFLGSGALSRTVVVYLLQTRFLMRLIVILSSRVAREYSRVFPPLPHPGPFRRGLPKRPIDGRRVRIWVERDPLRTPSNPPPCLPRKEPYRANIRRGCICPLPPQNPRPSYFVPTEPMICSQPVNALAED